MPLNFYAPYNLRWWFGELLMAPLITELTGMICLTKRWMIVGIWLLLVNQSKSIDELFDLELLLEISLVTFDRRLLYNFLAQKAFVISMIAYYSISWWIIYSPLDFQSKNIHKLDSVFILGAFHVMKIMNILQTFKFHNHKPETYLNVNRKNIPEFVSLSSFHFSLVLNFFWPLYFQKEAFWAFESL